MAGPQDPTPAGADRLMAGHADHEQVIEALKDALAQTRLTRGELDARAVRALAALTADNPAEAGPPAPARRRPLARAATGSGGCLVIAFAAVWVAGHLDDPFGPSPYESWIPLCFCVAIAALVAALFFLGYGVGASIEQRRSRRQSPPRPGPGGHPRVLRVTDDSDGGGADVVVW